MPGVTWDEVIERVAAGLRRLPGEEAQIRMAPRPRPGWTPGYLPPGTVPAAALLLVYPRDGDVILVLTVRAGHLPKHSGQVSLPGGMVEPGETLEEAALREAHEEVGIDPASVTLLGGLTPIHIPVSGFTLHPMVGVAAGRPSLRAAEDEVARILEVPVSHLIDASRHRRTRRMRDGTDYDVPYFELDGEQVWGATAMVLAEFATLIGHPPDPWTARHID